MVLRYFCSAGGKLHKLVIIAAQRLLAVREARAMSLQETPVKEHRGQFKPGNKAAVGRSRRWADFMAMARKYAPECIDYLVSVVRDPTARRADRINAASELLDRGLGKPVQGHVIQQQAPADEARAINEAMTAAEASLAYTLTLAVTGGPPTIEADAEEVSNDS